MGKLKRQRNKLHMAARHVKISSPEVSTDSNLSKLPDLVTPPKDNLFAGIHRDINNLANTSLNDDVQSLKSFKSLKSEKLSKKTILPKKKKIKMRRELLLRKIDTINEIKKNLQIRQKRKTTAIMGDTNPLHDALPSLESLLKNRPNIKQTVSTELQRRKSIDKSKKRKRELIQGVKMFKSVLNNKTFQKNPLEVILLHVQTLVHQDRDKIKK